MILITSIFFAYIASIMPQMAVEKKCNLWMVTPGWFTYQSRNF